MENIAIHFNITTPSYVEDIQIWLQENTVGSWQWRYIPKTKTRKIEFQLPSDAVAFTLKWATFD